MEDNNSMEIKKVDKKKNMTKTQLENTILLAKCAGASLMGTLTALTYTLLSFRDNGYVGTKVGLSLITLLMGSATVVFYGATNQNKKETLKLIRKNKKTNK